MKTPTIFRKIKKTGEHIALFPTLPGTSRWAENCMCYKDGRMQKFSLEDWNKTVHGDTRICQAIKKDLAALGYKIQVISNILPEHIGMRKMEVEKVA